MTRQPRTNPRGRPRHPDIDRRIAEATLTLLAERGYTGLSLEAVAAAAGITKPTLYRRWPGKAALVTEVLADVVPDLRVPEIDDPLLALQTMAVEFVVALTGNDYAPTVLAVHAEARHDPRLADLLRRDYLQPRADTIEDLVERARRHGRIDPDLSTDTVRDILFGPLVYRWLIVGDPIDHATAEQLITTAGRALRDTRTTTG